MAESDARKEWTRKKHRLCGPQTQQKHRCRHIASDEGKPRQTEIKRLVGFALEKAKCKTPAVVAPVRWDANKCSFRDECEAMEVADSGTVTMKGTQMTCKFSASSSRSFSVTITLLIICKDASICICDLNSQKCRNLMAPGHLRLS